jgi:hypothetical protein
MEEKTIVINGRKHTLKMWYRGSCSICAFHGKCHTLFDFLCELHWIDGEPIYFEEVKL